MGRSGRAGRFSQYRNHPGAPTGHEILASVIAAEFRPLPPRGGLVIETLILAALVVAVLTSLVLLIGQMLVRRRRDREEAERTGHSPEEMRTPEQQARDRQTAVIWGCAIVLVPAFLAAAYLLTR